MPHELNIYNNSVKKILTMKGNMKLAIPYVIPPSKLDNH
jgi:hypothetical protein